MNLIHVVIEHPVFVTASGLREKVALISFVFARWSDFLIVAFDPRQRLGGARSLEVSAICDRFDACGLIASRAQPGLG